MGTDIHSIAQVWKDGKWITVLQNVIGDPRSYDTFAVLANVRNGSGFAGCDTGDGFEPIDDPRGLPEDISFLDVMPIPQNTPTGHDYSWMEPEYRERRLAEIAKSEEVWLGDHSHSWITLNELDTYIQLHSSKKTKKRGFVREEQYLELKATNSKPNEYCGMVSGRDIEALTATNYDYLCERGLKPTNKTIYVQYEWEVGYLDATYIEDISKELHRLADLYDVEPKDVRYVFGFDS